MSDTVLELTDTAGHTRYVILGNITDFYVSEESHGQTTMPLGGGSQIFVKETPAEILEQIERLKNERYDEIKARVLSASHDLKWSLAEAITNGMQQARC